MLALLTILGSIAHGHATTIFTSKANLKTAVGEWCTDPAAADPQISFQLGKVGDDSFAVEWRWPLSPMAAFGTALAVCDAKLALSRRMEGVRSALRRGSSAGADHGGGANKVTAVALD